MSEDIPETGEQATPLEIGMSRNTMLVNGEVLRTDTTPEVVYRALTEGREEILAGLQRYREYMQRLNPDASVSIAPFQVVDLGNMKDKNLSKAGRIRARKEQIVRTPDVLRDDLIPLWEAIERSGFVPSVRTFYQYSGYMIDLWAELPAENS